MSGRYSSISGVATAAFTKAVNVLVQRKRNYNVEQLGWLPRFIYLTGDPAVRSWLIALFENNLVELLEKSRWGRKLDSPVQPADLMQDSLTVAFAGLRKTVVKSSIPGLKGITVRKEKIILLSDIERLTEGSLGMADAMSTYLSEIRLPNFKELLKELVYKRNNFGRLYPG